MTISETIAILEVKIEAQELMLKCSNSDGSKLRAMKAIESYQIKIQELKSL